MADETSWVFETVNDPEGFRTALKAEGPVRVIDSAQDLAVFENKTFGRVMILDGAYQITTGDEFVYHEMMAHVPLFAHGAARDVLIIGGGDGGVAREALRHPVDRVTMVEIDRAVVDLARELFPDVSRGAFDDPRLDLVIDDGAAFVANAPAGGYDVVIVDAPDPVGAGAVLFTADFYAGCRRMLKPGGVLVTQSGMPFLSADWLSGHAATLRGVFGAVSFFLTTVPSYVGGPMAHGFSTDDAGLAAVPVETLRARHAALGLTMRYWTPAVHAGAFALPAYVAEIVADGE
ncbi:polyamine aminopropyltransferase [Acuticoccus kandeliae]|uniref:polyamine aminopropyltransferase n=1 Tax=Acuticoccus kandeliae TaxID=2073160 RepID=UPI000D3E8D06|nr:polyamine aminopropyltransferase [Acuticoccus kandeliae]